MSCLGKVWNLDASFYWQVAKVFRTRLAGKCQLMFWRKLAFFFKSVSEIPMIIFQSFDDKLKPNLHFFSSLIESDFSLKSSLSVQNFGIRKSPQQCFTCLSFPFWGGNMDNFHQNKRFAWALLVGLKCCFSTRKGCKNVGLFGGIHFFFHQPIPV